MGLTILLSHRSMPRSACSSVTLSLGIKLAYSTVGGDFAMVEFHKMRLCKKSSAISLQLEMVRARALTLHLASVRRAEGRTMLDARRTTGKKIYESRV